MIPQEFQSPKGTRDVLAPESWQMEIMRRIAFDVAQGYGYDPLETPIFERSAVFLRVGETTDIVQHERYQFIDAGGDDLTLRPEGTAAVARAYIENGLAQAPQPVRLAYWGPMFRRENPQAGRYRQHTQFGVELYGSDKPEADVEVMLLATTVVERAGLSHPSIRVNSIGCATCRPRYREALIAYYRDHVAQLCEDCRTRLEQNPLRLLDCKRDVAVREDAPDLAEFWCEECRQHMDTVMTLAGASGRTIARDPHLVRGLDYYTRTVFEVGHPSIGDQMALFGGGRYDGLAATMGGPDAPAVGFGMGIERLLSALPEPLSVPAAPRIYVAHLPGLELEAAVLAESLRQAGFAAEADILRRSLKAQLKDAGRRAATVLIVGGREWANGLIVVRDLASGGQTEIPRDRLETFLHDNT